MKKLLIIILLIFTQFGPNLAQINKNGIPFLKNYSKEEYNAAEQNWAVCVDNRGVAYFGNHNGVIEFDGVNWNKIPVTNNSLVRSLAVDSLGTIYVGAIGEFGYLAPDINGKMQYVSLYEKKNDSTSIGDVLSIFVNNNEVFYCAGSSIFRFRDKKLEEFYQDTVGGFISFYINDRLIIGNYWAGLREFKNGGFSQLKGGDFYKSKDVFVILPLNEKEYFIGTMVQGADFYVSGNYIYNTETGVSIDISKYSDKFKKLSSYVKDGQLYSGIELKNGNFALTTINKGLIIINKNGDILYHFNKENGLGDNTVTDAFESKSGVLWLSPFNSLSYIELNSPFKKFDFKSGIEGIIIDIERFNGTLYVATSLGLYYQAFDKFGFPIFQMVKGMDQMVWTLNKIKTSDNKERLLAGTKINIYEIINKDNINVIKAQKDLINCNILFQSTSNKDRIYAGYLYGVTYIEFVNGKLTRNDDHTYNEISEPIETITEDENGDLWLGTLLNGVIKFNPDKGTIAKYGVEEGLPSLDGNKTYYINNEILFATNKGIYHYNVSNNKIEKYQKIKELYERSDKVFEVFSENDSIIWLFSRIINPKNPKENFDKIEKIITNNGNVNISELPFQRIRKQAFSNISFDADNNIWFSSPLAAINFDRNIDFDVSEIYYSINRDVAIQFDSIIFYGTNFSDTNSFIVSLKQPNILRKTLKYRNNSLRINFSSPYFPIDELKYRFKLEGFDEEWSNWDTKTYRDYTNLDEGSYIFKVKALNIYGVESEIAEYEFSIMPPWYRTFWALLLYILAALGVIAITVKLYTRKLRLEKIRLEQIVKERTEEVVKQKDEILLQRDEIAEKNKSITDSIEYAKRIQNAVLPSKEFALEVLPEHFILFRPRDIVSGDFYWFTKKDNLLILIAADCTGHGVPGAFMSMLGVSFINEIVNKHEVKLAGDILTHLRADVKRTLSQTGKEGEAKDGMDIALCVVDLENMKLQYAGAYNPMYLFRNNELMEFKADRMPIGIYVKEKDTFTNNEIDLQKGDVFYIFSDGYEDQFGGEDGQKLKSKNFKILLQEIHQKPMAEQREILNTKIDKWRGRWEQVDDIIVFGVRIP